MTDESRDATSVVQSTLDRRRFLKGSAAGGAALATGGLLAACGSSKKSSSSSSAAGSSSAGSSSAAAATGLGAQLQQILGKPQNLLTKGPGQVKLAAELALTGAGSDYGTLQGDGWKYGSAHVQAWSQGKLSFGTSYYDNQSGVPAAESAGARKAGLSGVPILLSSYIFGFGALLPYAAQFKMFTPDPGGGTGPIPGPYVAKPYCYGFRAPYPTGMLDGIVKYLTQKFPTKKKWVSVQPVIAPPYNDAVAAYESKLWSSYGVQHLGEVMAPLGATDYSATIEKIKSYNPDVVLWTTFGTDPAYQAKQMQQAGVNVINAGVDFIPQPVKLAGGAYKDWYFGLDYLNTVTPPSDWSKFFVTNWQKDHGGALPAYYNAGDYITAFAVAMIIDRILGFGGDVSKGDDYVKGLEQDPTFPHVYGGSGSQLGQIVIDPTTHGPKAIPLLLFQSKGTGNVADITPLATYNLNGSDFTLI